MKDVVRLWCDVGGTFTDLVALSWGLIFAGMVPLTVGYK